MPRIRSWEFALDACIASHAKRGPAAHAESASRAPFRECFLTVNAVGNCFRKVTIRVNGSFPLDRARDLALSVIAKS